MSGGIRVESRESFDYCWIGRTQNKSQLCVARENVVILTEPKQAEETIKVTFYAYNKATKIYDNKGTIIFRVAIPDGKQKEIGYTLAVQSVCLAPPADGTARWDQGTPQPMLSVEVSVSLPYFVWDVAAEYAAISHQIRTASSKIETALTSANNMPGCDHCEWFVRQSQMEYEWPFCMPGCTGIRQAGYGVPTVAMVDALIKHACVLCGFSAEKFAECRDNDIRQRVIEGLACVAMGAAGYSNGYSNEVCRHVGCGKPWGGTCVCVY